MPSESPDLQPDGPGATGPGQVPGPSRRSVLRNAAGAGVAGLAASALIGTSALPALARATGPAARRHDDQAGPADDAGRDDRDIVVHLRDVRSGEMDIFAGTSHTRLRDPELAARLARQAG
jgi:hypothetical protein